MSSRLGPTFSRVGALLELLAEEIETAWQARPPAAASVDFVRPICYDVEAGAASAIFAFFASVRVSLVPHSVRAEPGFIGAPLQGDCGAVGDRERYLEMITRQLVMLATCYTNRVVHEPCSMNCVLLLCCR